MTDKRDNRLADIIAIFTDKINQNPNKRFLEDFLDSYPDIEDNLRPLLTTILTLKLSASLPTLSQETRDTLFKRITKNLVNGGAEKHETQMLEP